MSDTLKWKKEVLRLLVFQTMSLRQARGLFVDIVENHAIFKESMSSFKKKEEVKRNERKEKREKRRQRVKEEGYSLNVVMDGNDTEPDSEEDETPTSNTKSSPESPSNDTEDEPQTQTASKPNLSEDQKWLEKMYRKLQKQIHPDKNKHVAKEGTKIVGAMEQKDIVAALYSWYVYNEECPIPEEQIETNILEIQKEYINLRTTFDRKPIDVILRSPQDRWNDILKQCVIPH